MQHANSPPALSPTCWRTALPPCPQRTALLWLATKWGAARSSRWDCSSPTVAGLSASSRDALWLSTGASLTREILGGLVQLFQNAAAASDTGRYFLPLPLPFKGKGKKVYPYPHPYLLPLPFTRTLTFYPYPYLLPLPYRGDGRGGGRWGAVAVDVTAEGVLPHAIPYTPKPTANP